MKEKLQKLKRLRSKAVFLLVFLGAFDWLALPLPTGLTARATAVRPSGDEANSFEATLSSVDPIKSSVVPRKARTVIQSDNANNIRVIESYGRLPLHFERNMGQLSDEIKFLSRGNGYTLLLTSSEAMLLLSRSMARRSGLGNRQVMSETVEDGGAGAQAVLRMKLVGANSEAEVVGLEELPGKSNYFVGNDPSKWRTNIIHYGKVRFGEVYPGVDLFYYGNQGQLEYDFIVAPGADPSVIRVAFEGAEKINIDSQGNLILNVAGGTIRLKKPHLYQEIDGQKKEVAGAFFLHSLANRGAPNWDLDPDAEGYVSEGVSRSVGFQVAAYDATKPLIIDPVLSYSTYLGGLFFNSGHAIAVDAAGNAYVTGQTDAPDFPTASPFQASCGLKSDGLFCSNDVFVTKLNSKGSALVYSTYLGGSGDDSGNGIAIDSAGNVYITGYTASTDFPTTTGTFDATCGTDGNCNFNGTSNIRDAFVTKLNATGSTLIYSTFLGGGHLDEGYAIAVDASGNAYVTGATDSSNFPTTSGAFDTSCGTDGTCNSSSGGEPFFLDAFVTKLTSTGSALLYSTFLGGVADDFGRGIAIDAAGNAYVTGKTKSSNFPTLNPIQPPSLAVKHGDAFVTKLNATGSALIYSTHLGGNFIDDGFAITVDSGGNVYVAGQTASNDFPTVNPFQDFLDGAADAFVAKLDSTGSALVYSTYLGGSASTDNEAGQGIAVDEVGNAYVTGQTLSSDFPTTADAFDSNCGTESCRAFFFKLDASGSELIFATYLGRGKGLGLALDSSASAYVVGETESENFPVTVGAFQTTNNGTSNAFVIKIGEPTGTVPIISVVPASQDYGSVNLGSSADRNFTVQNIGGGTLSGSASTSAPFSIVAGGSYNLAGGASQAVTVRFTPSSGVTSMGNVSFTGGGGASGSVKGKGVAMTLTVTKAGLGSGTVTSNPTGITCGSTCSAPFSPSSSVTLTASPASGSVFAGWSGAGCSGTGTCAVTMNADKSVTATFDLQTFTLTVASAGSAGGTISSSPAGINCGSDCSEAYAVNTSVTLTAAAGSGGSFKGWSGACSGSSTSCSVLMGAAKSVKATFSKTYTDDPITAQSTLIKAVHITDLRQAINTLRSNNSLSSFSYTDSTLTAATTQVKAVHITDLRSALNGVYTAKGLTQPSYTDPTITAGQTTAKKAHIAEIRQAVKDAE